MRRARFIEAAGLSIPGVVGTFVWGIIAGIAMIQSGMSVGQALGMTLIVFSANTGLGLDETRRQLEAILEDPERRND